MYICIALPLHPCWNWYHWAGRIIALPCTPLITLTLLLVGYIALHSISLLTVISLWGYIALPCTSLLTVTLLQVECIALLCTSLQTVISLKGYCIVRVWWSLSLCCFTLELIICYIIFLMLVIMCRIQAFITWVFLAPSLILFIVIYKIYVIKLYFNSKNLCALLLSTFCFQRNSQKMHWKKAVKLFLIFLILTLDCLFPILQFTQNIKLHTI